MDELKLSNDILELEGIDYVRDNIWTHYSNNEVGIPRVTKILNYCGDKEGLINFAASSGKWYKYITDQALEVGTTVHELIDRYLLSYTSGEEFLVDYNEYPEKQRNKIHNAVQNFIIWHNKIKELGYDVEVLYIEERVTCPWFGGTVDAIFRINGKVYLIDFKTSREISTSYMIQTSAYMWLINNGYTPHIPHIDGIGIIRVDKNEIGIIDEYFLNDFNPVDHFSIEQYQACFMSYVNAYYRGLSTAQIFSNRYNNYQSMEPIKENINE